jgi:hypothetical protein
MFKDSECIVWLMSSMLRLSNTSASEMVLVSRQLGCNHVILVILTHSENEGRALAPEALGIFPFQLLFVSKGKLYLT